MGEIEIAEFDWLCAMCGTKEGLSKYEIVVSVLPEQACDQGPVGSFHRHLCHRCGRELADQLRAAMDSHGIQMKIIPGLDIDGIKTRQRLDAAMTRSIADGAEMDTQEKKMLYELGFVCGRLAMVEQLKEDIMDRRL